MPSSDKIDCNQHSSAVPIERPPYSPSVLDFERGFSFPPGEKIRTHIDTVPTSAASVIWEASPISIFICTKLMKGIRTEEKEECSCTVWHFQKRPLDDERAVNL